MGSNHAGGKKTFFIAAMTALILLSACTGASTGKVTQREAEATDGTRSVTLYIPEISEDAAVGNDRVKIDLSHVSRGYIAVNYTGDNEKPKMQITYADEVYTYNLASPGEYAVYPLSCGDGNYSVNIYENISGNQYMQAYGKSFSVKLDDEFLPFLYPNVYVNFTADSQAVALSNKLTADIGDELDAVAAIYDYVTGNIYYDEDKAADIDSVYGYIPDLDDVLRKRKGICFDYASLMTAMLRAQDIPTKLVFGYAGEAYHAWISVYIKEVGWIDGIIEFDGVDWTRMDPTFAANGATQNSRIREFIGDGSNYNPTYYY